jgi:hypothetical protein
VTGPAPDRAELLAHARAELAMREKHWPARVTSQQMGAGEAEADIAAWRAIVELMETGGVDVADPAVPLWPEILAAARAAEARRFDRLAAASSAEREARATQARRAGEIRRLLERSAWHPCRRAA